MTLRAVVLAAGASTRLGEPKALARIGDRTALEHLVAAACFALDGPVHVVVGRHSREIRRELEGLERVIWVDSPDWKEGRTASLASGARSIGDGIDLLVAPVDTPLVSGTTLAALRKRWEDASAPERGWLAPCVESAGGRRFGHPILLGRGLAAELTDMPPDRPLRDLRRVAAPLLRERTHDRAVLDDLDTPSDLLAIRARVDRQG